MTFWSVLVLGLFVCFPAHAHVAVAGSEGFVTGLTQPLFEIGAGIGAVATGLFLGQKTSNLNEKAAIVFLAGLSAGLGTAFFPSLPDLPFEFVYGVSLITGLLIAIAHPLNRLLDVPLSLFAGLLIGAGSVPEPASIAATAYTTAGSLIGMTFLFLYGLSAAQWMTAPERQPWLSIALRVLGSWIFTVALLMTALSVRG